MERKPVIVIMTSRGEFGGASEALAQAVRREGTHNVVILDESKYDSRARFSRLDKLMQISDEYRMVADKRMTAKEAFRYDREGERSGGRMGRRSRRIANAVKRYRPEFLLAVTPYACAVAAEAKRKAGFGTSVIYMMNGFVVHGEGAVHDADCYIVENGDMKAELVQRGVPSRKVMVLGLPFDAPDLTPIEKEAKKQELGLPRTPTVFLNERGKRERAELLRLLTDQGNILNTVCYTGDPASVASLRAISDEEGGVGGDGVGGAVGEGDGLGGVGVVEEPVDGAGGDVLAEDEVVLGLLDEGDGGGGVALVEGDEIRVGEEGLGLGGEVFEVAGDEQGRGEEAPEGHLITLLGLGEAAGTEGDVGAVGGADEADLEDVGVVPVAFGGVGEPAELGATDGADGTPRVLDVAGGAPELGVLGEGGEVLDGGSVGKAEDDVAAGVPEVLGDAGGGGDVVGIPVDLGQGRAR